MTESEVLDTRAVNPPASGGPQRSGEVGFRAFVETGAALAALHVGYEQADEYPLTQIVNKDVPWTWHVTKMRLSKDKTTLAVYIVRQVRKVVTVSVETVRRVAALPPVVT